MRAAIDKAGRLVIPKALRDSLGLVPGEVEVTPDGAGLHVEPLANDELAKEDGFLVIPADAPVSDSDRALGHSLCSALARFAATGRAGASEWPAYQPDEDRHVRRFGGLRTPARACPFSSTRTPSRVGTILMVLSWYACSH